MSIDKSLTKKLLDDVIVKDEPKVDRYVPHYPSHYVDNGGSWMDDWDKSHGWQDRGNEDHLMQTGQDHPSAKAVVDSNRTGGMAIELDRHDTDEVIGLLAKKMESVLQKEGFVMTPDSRDELEGSLLAVVDLCKWKSGTSLYVLKLR